MKIGAFSGCHQLYHRSFHVKGYQFPVCARCTGLFLGQLLALVSIPFYLKFSLIPFLVLAGVSVVFLGIDGVGQLKGHWESTNRRRLITGTLSGFFIGIITVKLIVLLVV